MNNYLLKQDLKCSRKTVFTVSDSQPSEAKQVLDRIPTIVLVAVGGALGAMTRYLVGTLLLESEPIPWGTLAVNVVGSFLLGIVVTLFKLGLMDSQTIVFLGVGFMGSFTTMSSFAVETLSLSDESLELALLNFIIMISTVLIAALAGRSLVLFWSHVEGS